MNLKKLEKLEYQEELDLEALEHWRTRYSRAREGTGGHGALESTVGPVESGKTTGLAAC